MSQGLRALVKLFSMLVRQDIYHGLLSNLG
jgi:hypothetical protein